MSTASTPAACAAAGSTISASRRRRSPSRRPRHGRRGHPDVRIDAARQVDGHDQPSCPWPSARAAARQAPRSRRCPPGRRRPGPRLGRSARRRPPRPPAARRAASPWACARSGLTSTASTRAPRRARRAPAYRRPRRCPRRRRSAPPRGRRRHLHPVRAQRSRARLAARRMSAPAGSGAITRSRLRPVMSRMGSPIVVSPPPGEGDRRGDASCDIDR